MKKNMTKRTLHDSLARSVDPAVSLKEMHVAGSLAERCPTPCVAQTVSSFTFMLGAVMFFTTHLLRGGLLLSLSDVPASSSSANCVECTSVSVSLSCQRSKVHLRFQSPITSSSLLLRCVFTLHDTKKKLIHLRLCVCFYPVTSGHAQTFTVIYNLLCANNSSHKVLICKVQSCVSKQRTCMII